MSGIYIHIPFCKKACHYCNFHFSTSLRYKDAMIEAILTEIEWQKNYLNKQTIDTIYFGGGTPSLLSVGEIWNIIEQINCFHTVNPAAEITLEANPDDLTMTQLTAFKTTPINRFSIGIQSFFEEDLTFMNRAHNAKEALNCIKNAQQAGFENLTIDLIYGTPTMNNQKWKHNIATTFQLQIPHISCYALTVEPNTALDHFIKKGKVAPLDEEKTAQQFEILVEQMTKQGYEHYEISNFAKPNCYAVHNSNYWKGKHYLGIGPSAHSFNGHSRQWNVAHNANYIKSINQQKIPYEIEQLSEKDQYNEYLLTGLRTKWGVDLKKIKQWGEETAEEFLKNVAPLLKKQQINRIDDHFILTSKGKLLADSIISNLFL